MTETATTRPGRTWLVIATAIVIGVLAGAGIVWMLNRPQSAAGGSPAPVTPPALTTAVPVTTASPTPSSPPSASSTAEPSPGSTGADWCLGGQDPFAAVLLAQSQAPLTADGAAAFARTVGRWSATFPIDPAADKVFTQIADPSGPLAKKGLADLNQDARTLRDKGYSQGTVSPDRSVYRVVSLTKDASGNISADVTIRLYRELTKTDGTVDELEMTTDMGLHVRDGKWVVFGSLPPLSDPDSSTNIKPWVPYLGAC